MESSIIDCFGYSQLPPKLQVISKEFAELAQKVNDEKASDQDYINLHTKIGKFESNKPFMTMIAKRRLVSASNITLLKRDKLILIWEAKNAAVMAAV